jgi:hypothetical protein
MLFAEALLIPDAQQVIMGLLLSFNLEKLLRSWSTGIFNAPLI